MSYLQALAHSQDKSLPAFQRAQYAFTAHIRAPETVPAPDDIEDRRMQIYRELLFNNVKGFIDSCFPVLRRLLTESEWTGIIRVFFSQKSCDSPFFNDINTAFVEWLSEETVPLPERIAPFAKELAHYEWLEMVLTIADSPALNLPPESLSAESVIKVSPVATAQAYQFDVHRIGAAYIPSIPPEEPTFLLVYRNTMDEIHFSQISAQSYQVISFLEEADKGLSVHALGERLAVLLGQSSEAVIPPLLALLREWGQRGIVVT